MADFSIAEFFDKLMGEKPRPATDRSVPTDSPTSAKIAALENKKAADGLSDAEEEALAELKAQLEQEQSDAA